MIKATIVLSVAAWIIPRLRARSAAERHLLWAIGLFAAALTPLIAVLVPSWQPDWAQRALSMVPGPFRVAPQWTAGPSADIVVRASGIEASTFWTVGRLVALAWG